MQAQRDWAEQLPRFIGKKEWIKHLNGERLTPQQAIFATAFVAHQAMM